jgi:C-terminal processing protease CtpA/Prc
VKNRVYTNDRLIAVGGRKVNGEPLATIAGLLSGKEDTAVTLTVLKGDEQVNDINCQASPIGNMLSEEILVPSFHCGGRD